MNERFEFGRRIEDVSPEAVDRQQAEVMRAPLPEIVTCAFLYDEGGTVTYEYPELTALCPMTGIQDLYMVRITYIPDRRIPELKSLRTYFLAFRDLPFFHEHLVCRIFEDFARAVTPKRLRVELDVAIRGGIHTTVVRESE